jgi:tRNA-splicing ligase RtcB
MPRTYDEELKFIERINSHSWRIKKGFVPNMNVCLIFIIRNHHHFLIG